MTAKMEVAIAGPEITASSPPYVVTVAATIATFNETQFKESVLSVMRARKPGRAMMGVVVEVLSMREKDSAAHTKFHPQATVLEVTFQVVWHCLSAGNKGIGLVHSCAGGRDRRRNGVGTKDGRREQQSGKGWRGASA